MEREIEIKRIEKISNAEGCQIIDIKRIESISNVESNSTFSGHCQGLMNELGDYLEQNQMEGAVVVLSGDGNGHFLAKPDIRDVLDRFNAANSSAIAGVEEEAAETEAQKRIRQAVESGRWEETMADLGPEELDEMYAEMQCLKRETAAELEKLTAAERDSPAGGYSIGETILVD